MDINDSGRLKQALQRLSDLIRLHTPSTGTFATAIPNLTLMHADQLSEPLESVYKPSLCIVAQGAKTAVLADEIYRYDPSSYLITSVELPITGRIIEAAPEHPYLSLKLTFDTDMILDITKDMHLPDPDYADVRGISVNRISPPLLEALVRLLELLDEPGDIPVMAPLILREILYRVLQGDQGAALLLFGIPHSHARAVGQAIREINRQFNRPLAIERLAQSANLSPSAFHKYFKRFTRMSPLQYQKTVRLQDARRLMLVESLSVSDAAYQVGYESPSQFSREYARMYGRSPSSDVQAQLAKT
ncbi:AraC family transcriptional regulator [Paenibacillus sp. 1P07SE]|uniref:AraC family transcriptional regulator n=1 Tax=Paenibacillus sp. 1P07SE TaxID=3132209 RepID=UPI0039A5D580